MQRSVEIQILKAILYSDIFDYPLTAAEILKFLPAGIEISDIQLAKYLKNSKFVEESDNFYFILGRKNIVSVRKKREELSDKKIKKAQKIIKVLSAIPTVKFIGISGGLAMKNSEEKDDIDLFIISHKDSLWITRMLIIFILKAMGKHRGRRNKNIKDRICINMLAEEGSISFPKERQDFYTAHEIVQLLPIFERDSMYKKFLWANKWITKYLPNAIDIKILRYKDIKKTKKAPNILVSNILISLLNPLAKSVQLFSIKKHKTIEVVSDSFLAFHPFDYKNHVLKLYNRSLKKYGIREKI